MNPPPSLGGVLPVMAPHMQYMSMNICINNIIGRTILNSENSNGVSIHSSLK